jgi:hypothetical protein
MRFTRHLLLLSVSLAFFGVPCANAQCLLEESFSGTSGLTWTPWQQSSAYVYFNNNAGKQYVDVSTNISPYRYSAGIETNYWSLDLNHDFAFTVDWSNAASGVFPDGYVRLNMVLKRAAEGSSETPNRGAVLSLVRYGANTGATNSLRQWQVFDGGTNPYAVQGSTVSNTQSGVSYVAATDTLTMDNVAITNFLGTAGLRALAGQYVELAFTASSYYTTGQSSTVIWVDGVCFTSGTFAGSLTGACCFEGQCAQGFQSMCGGNFLGPGTSCDLLGTCYDQSCPGDFTGDGSADSDDVLEVLNAWGQACDACTGDGSGQTVAGVGDLMVILRNWGICG